MTEEKNEQRSDARTKRPRIYIKRKVASSEWNKKKKTVEYDGTENHPWTKKPYK